MIDEACPGTEQGGGGGGGPGTEQEGGGVARSNNSLFATKPEWQLGQKKCVLPMQRQKKLLSAANDFTN